MTSITTLPCDNLDAASIASYNLLLISSLIINLSTITSILCFLFFSSSFASLVSNSSPSTRSLMYPSFISELNKSLNVPFSPWTTGLNTLIFVPFSNFRIWLVISSILWLVIGLWWIGQYGIPILAYKSLK